VFGLSGGDILIFCIVGAPLIAAIPAFLIWRRRRK
jgi:hypothetical protein